MAGDNDNKQQRSPSAIAVCLIVAFALPLLYAMSIGPVVWLSGHDYLSGKTAVMKAFYAPLIFVASQWGPMLRLLRWYVDLWRG